MGVEEEDAAVLVETPKKTVAERGESARVIASNVRNFSARALIARTRAAELRARLGSDAKEQPTASELTQVGAVLDGVAEELSVASEELTVADEELCRQNEELIEARIAADVERRRYVDLFESAPDPYFVTDRVGIICEANRAASIALQMSASFLVGKPLVNFVARSDCKKLRAALSRLAKHEHVTNLQLRVRPRQHMPIFLADISATAMRPTGDTLRIRWQMRDVTRRSDAAEQAHRESVASLTAILGWAHVLSLDGVSAETRARAAETIERRARAILASDARRAPGASEPPRPALPPGPTDVRGARVLVVGDQMDIRDLLRALLLHHGAEVETASSVDDAIPSLGSFCPDVLVIDGAAPVPPLKLPVVHVAQPIEPRELLGAIAAARESVAAK